MLSSNIRNPSIIRKLSDVLFTIRTQGKWNRNPVEVVVSIDRIKRFTAARRGVIVPYTDYQKQDFQLEDEFLSEAEKSGIEHLRLLHAEIQERRADVP